MIEVRNNITINNQTINTNDTERYFLVESTRGYIIINREYEHLFLYYMLICFYLLLI